MTGISTSIRNIKKLFELIKSADFPFIEINHRVEQSELKKIFNFCKKRGIWIRGFHAPAPLPKKYRNLETGFLVDLVNDNDEIVQNSIKMVLNTIKWAKRTHAEYVVLHGGGKRNFGEKEFISSYMKENFERKKNSRIWLSRFYKNFEKILKIAEREKIIIALENRYYPFEFPDNEELIKIFEKFPSEYLRFWLDTGHNFVRERLKIEKKGSAFKLFKQRILGFHIHNVKGLKDHQSPLDGEINFKKMIKNIKEVKKPILVYEIGENVEIERFLKEKKEFEKLLGIPEIIPRRLWKAKKNKKNYNFPFLPERIILHHTVVPTIREYRGSSSIAGIQNFHFSRKFIDIGYHFIISPKGEIFQGRPFFSEGAHIKSKNKSSIGIALIGNFEIEKPTEKQIASLKKLTASISYFFPIKEIKLHKDYKKNTLCPGKNLIDIFKEKKL